MRSFTAALVQLCARVDEPEANLARAVALVDQAADSGAELIVLPESYAVLGGSAARKDAWAADPADPARCPALAPLLSRTQGGGPVIVAGGTPERCGHAGRWFNTAFVLGYGQVLARYRKIHRFDATTVGAPPPESQTTEAGTNPVVVRTELGTLGLSICYDLRFGELYRALVDAGAELLLVPSAFTYTTGLAHWEPLLRARAIESQAYVLAAAQHGVHDDPWGKRRSFGHSMIVDPWGKVLASAPEGDGVVLAQLSATARPEAAAMLPCLSHRRLGEGAHVEVVDATLRGAPA